MLRKMIKSVTDADTDLPYTWNYEIDTSNGDIRTIYHVQHGHDFYEFSVRGGEIYHFWKRVRREIGFTDGPIPQLIKRVVA